MIFALTAGDVNAFYRGGNAELKLVIIWLMAYGSIGATIGMLTYGICDMVNKSNTDHTKLVPGSSSRIRGILCRDWSYHSNLGRDPYRVVWTEQEVSEEFNEESVRWHNFERTAEGYIVTYQGKVVHPYKPVNKWQVRCFIAGICVLMVVLSIPMLIWVLVHWPVFAFYQSITCPKGPKK